MAEPPSRAMFVDSVHTRFRLDTGAERDVALDLEEVVDLPPAGPYGQFSLRFLGPAAPALRQGSYRVRHDRLGGFTLFLVPVARDGRGMWYEASFSQIGHPGSEGGAQG